MRHFIHDTWLWPHNEKSLHLIFRLGLTNERPEYNNSNRKSCLTNVKGISEALQKWRCTPRSAQEDWKRRTFPFIEWERPRRGGSRQVIRQRGVEKIEKDRTCGANRDWQFWHANIESLKGHRVLILSSIQNSVVRSTVKGARTYMHELHAHFDWREEDRERSERFLPHGCRAKILPSRNLIFEVGPREIIPY